MSPSHSPDRTYMNSDSASSNQEPCFNGAVTGLVPFASDRMVRRGGFFSHTGKLYMAHHLWAYKALQTREDIRNAVWHKHSWEELVYYAVPLMQEVESRIMIPQKTSPLHGSNRMEMCLQKFM